MQILDSADHLINDLRFAEQRWSLVLSITAAVIVQSGNVWLQGKIPLEKNLILFKSVDLIDVRHNQIYYTITDYIRSFSYLHSSLSSWAKICGIIFRSKYLSLLLDFLNFVTIVFQSSKQSAFRSLLIRASFLIIFLLCRQCPGRN
jgi:hypothetical protein